MSKAEAVESAPATYRDLLNRCAQQFRTGIQEDGEPYTIKIAISKAIGDSGMSPKDLLALVWKESSLTLKEASLIEEGLPKPFVSEDQRQMLFAERLIVGELNSAGLIYQQTHKNRRWRGILSPI